MNLKDIALLVDSDSEAATAFAVSAASKLDARLTVIAPVVEPGNFAFEASAILAKATIEEARRIARRTVDATLEQAGQIGCGIDAEMPEMSAGFIIEATGGLLRCFDLTIVQQNNPDSIVDRTSLIEAALFGSGRPVLLVPYTYRLPPLFGKVIVAWNGGQSSAARAVGDALPILVEAKRVEVVTIEERAGEKDPSGTRLTRHLQRHGINVDLRNLTSAGNVASSLLSYAADFGADLIVMGGYGHSRFREFVLGGATRDMLSSMTMPVLMSH